MDFYIDKTIFNITKTDVIYLNKEILDICYKVNTYLGNNNMLYHIPYTNYDLNLNVNVWAGGKVFCKDLDVLERLIRTHKTVGVFSNYKDSYITLNMQSFRSIKNKLVLGNNSLELIDTLLMFMENSIMTLENDEFKYVEHDPIQISNDIKLADTNVIQFDGNVIEYLQHVYDIDSMPIYLLGEIDKFYGNFYKLVTEILEQPHSVKLEYNSESNRVTIIQFDSPITRRFLINEEIVKRRTSNDGI